MTSNKATLAKRVAELEQRGCGPVRFCWLGDEPADLRPGEDLIVVSWEGEEAE